VRPSQLAGVERAADLLEAGRLQRYRDHVNTEDGTLCLACGARLAYLLNGAWASEDHAEDCNVDDVEHEDGALIVVVCVEPDVEDGAGCDWARIVPAWADEDGIREWGCCDCTSEDVVIVRVRGPVSPAELVRRWPETNFGAEPDATPRWMCEYDRGGPVDRRVLLCEGPLSTIAAAGARLLRHLAEQERR
jgi:hypothetical protein